MYKSRELNVVHHLVPLRMSMKSEQVMAALTNSSILSFLSSLASA